MPAGFLGKRTRSRVEALSENGLFRFDNFQSLDLDSAEDDMDTRNYRQLSAGGLRVLRAVRKSRCQAVASFTDNSFPASASARFRPVQTFSLYGNFPCLTFVFTV